jgi:hypothetical protein
MNWAVNSYSTHVGALCSLRCIVNGQSQSESLTTAGQGFSLKGHRDGFFMPEPPLGHTKTSYDNFLS